jgi:2-aminobenzoate-CoA ligase
MVAVWLAVTKAGAVAVNTMPLLRAGELTAIVDKGEVTLALCDNRIADELVACAKDSRFLKSVVCFDGTSNHDAELDRVALNKPVRFDAVRTGRDDVALLGFTSARPASPRPRSISPRPADHRGRLREGSAAADAAGRVRRVAASRVHLRPRRPGRVPARLRRDRHAARERVARQHDRHHRDLQGDGQLHLAHGLPRHDGGDGRGADLSSLRMAVSAGETLPAPVFEDWTRKTGKPILDGIGSTELLHIFITNRLGDAAPGATGRPVTGYEARIVDDDMREVPDGTVGHLAVRGPTGCRYLADDRQTTYVRDGFNLPGDDFVRDSTGVFHFVARADDMIIQAATTSPAPRSRRRCCRSPTSPNAPSSACRTSSAGRSCRRTWC